MLFWVQVRVSIQNEWKCWAKRKEQSQDLLPNLSCQDLLMMQSPQMMAKLMLVCVCECVYKSVCGCMSVCERECVSVSVWECMRAVKCVWVWMSVSECVWVCVLLFHLTNTWLDWLPDRWGKVSCYFRVLWSCKVFLQWSYKEHQWIKNWIDHRNDNCCPENHFKGIFPQKHCSWENCIWGNPANCTAKGQHNHLHNNAGNGLWFRLLHFLSRFFGVRWLGICE